MCVCGVCVYALTVDRAETLGAIALTALISESSLSLRGDLILNQTRKQ